MQHRRSSAGRPSGTDGSDFSYRMVVDSRYQKVAEGRSRMRSLILIQTAVVLGAALPLSMSVSKGEAVNALSVSSLAIGVFSLVIGELVQSRSRASLLRFYMIASSLSVVLSVASVIKGNLTLQLQNPMQDIKNARDWQAKKFELLEGCRIFLGRWSTHAMHSWLEGMNHPFHPMAEALQPPFWTVVDLMIVN